MTRTILFMMGPALRVVLVLFALALVRRIALALARPRAVLAGVGEEPARSRLNLFVDPLGLSIGLTAVCSLLLTVLAAGHLGLVGVRGSLTLSQEAAAVLALGALAGLFATAVIAFARGAHKGLRHLGRAFFVCLALTLVTGLLVGHPEYSPFAYRGALLLHILSAEAALVLAPFLAVRRKEVRS